MSYSHLVF